MEPQGNGRRNSPASFETTSRGTDDARSNDGHRRRRFLAIGLVWAAVVFAAVSTLGFGSEFLDVRWGVSHGDHSLVHRHREVTSFGETALNGAVWMLATTMSIAAPIWFWWWRRSRVTCGSAIGVLVSALGIGAVCFAVSEQWTFAGTEWNVREFEVSGTYPTLILADAAFALAFLVAPPPRGEGARSSGP